MAFVSVACAQAGTFSGPAAQPHPADAPPVDFQVKRYPGGEPFDIASERGNVVLLDVWATWCAPCLEALPAYDKLAGEYAERGLRVYALNVDEDLSLISDFLKETKVSLPILLDPDSSIAESVLKIKNLPTTLLLDRQGRVRYFHQGFTDKSIAKYKTEIDQLLAEPVQ